MSKVNARKRGKTWEYRFEIASVDGKRKQSTKGGFRTKADALKAGTDAAAKYNSCGQVVGFSNNTSYADYLSQWMNDYVRPNLKQSSMRNYRSVIDKHILPELGGYRISAITYSVLQQFINQKAADGLAKNTIHVILAVIKSSFKYARRAGLISMNPSLEIAVPKSASTGTKDIRAYSTDEILSFLKMLQGTTSYYAVMIAYHTGMRIGEISALTWDDIDLDKMVISVNKTLTVGEKGLAIGSPKTITSIRSIPFGDDLKRTFRCMRRINMENEMYYGEYYYYNYLDSSGKIHQQSKVLNTDLEKANFIFLRENGKLFTSKDVHMEIKKLTNGQLKFHNIRHTHATILIEENVPLKTVQQRLGHADISTTIDKYVDNTDSMKKTAVHAIEKAWTNGGQIKVQKL